MPPCAESTYQLPINANLRRPSPPRSPSKGTFRGRNTPRFTSRRRVGGPLTAAEFQAVLQRLEAKRGTLRPRNVPFEGNLGLLTTKYTNREQNSGTVTWRSHGSLARTRQLGLDAVSRIFTPPERSPRKSGPGNRHLRHVSCAPNSAETQRVVHGIRNIGSAFVFLFF
jgi:hypothetical protein